MVQIILMQDLFCEFYLICREENNDIWRIWLGPVKYSYEGGKEIYTCTDSLGFELKQDPRR